MWYISLLKYNLLLLLQISKVLGLVCCVFENMIIASEFAAVKKLFLGVCPNYIMQSPGMKRLSYFSVPF